MAIRAAGARCRKMWSRRSRRRMGSGGGEGSGAVQNDFSSEIGPGRGQGAILGVARSCFRAWEGTTSGSLFFEGPLQVAEPHVEGGFEFQSQFCAVFPGHAAGNAGGHVLVGGELGVEFEMRIKWYVTGFFSA